MTGERKGTCVLLKSSVGEGGEEGRKVGRHKEKNKKVSALQNLP